MKTLVIIEKDQNGYGAFTENLSPVLHGSGVTVEEAKSELLEGYRDLLDYYRENGESVPEVLQDLTFEYKYDISAMFNVFDFLNASKFAEWIGVSPSLMRHYKSGDTYISQKQAKKIESGLHEIGRQFLSFTL
ncbi:MAG: pilus assembly protein HicB [Bacteroidales bacterium]|nr:pilus assembly protein HicB [Bacteroidales bacterium]